DGEDTPPPTTTEAPQPIVTIKVEDVPAPPTTEAPELEPSSPTTASADTPIPTAAPETTEDAQAAPPTSDGQEQAVVAPTTTLNPVQVHSDETAVVTGTQPAAADTGNNATSNEQTPQGGGQQDNAIDTGTADAIGSQDTNSV